VADGGGSDKPRILGPASWSGARPGMVQSIRYCRVLIAVGCLDVSVAGISFPPPVRAPAVPDAIRWARPLPPPSGGSLSLSPSPSFWVTVRTMVTSLRCADLAVARVAYRQDAICRFARWSSSTPHGDGCC